MSWICFLFIVSARLTPWFELCSFHSIEISEKIEPSDLAFGNEKLYLVSDNGRLLILNSNDQLEAEIKIEGKPDLEGVAADLQDHNILYLGVGKKLNNTLEYPASILVFNLTSRTIIKKLDVQADFENLSKTSKRNGMESLAYHISDEDKTYFLVGRQSDAVVFVYEYEKSNMSLTLYKVFNPPGPGMDLSAITIWNSRIWFLYDKGQEMRAVKLNQLKSENGIFEQDQSVGKLVFGMRGLEGISFVNWNETIWVYLAIDPPKKYGKKQLLKYKLESFFACYSNGGMEEVLKNLSLF